VSRAVLYHTDSGADRFTEAIRAPRADVAALLTRPPLGFEQERASFSAWLEPPRPELTLMIDIEGELRVDGARLPDAWVAGLSDRPTVVDFSPPYRSLELKLTPAGARAVLGRPLHELGGATTVSLSDLLGRDGRVLAQRLRETADWDARFDLVEAFLARRVDAEPRGTSPVVAWALRRLRETGGRIRIGALAAELNCSRRHLAALFADGVGVAPKTMARLLRFELLCRGLDAAPGRWADVAAQCGYADQPHLNREVRALAGISPSELVARRMRRGALVGDGLPSVQATAATGA
jgi:AraC-like DNA-binding protein